MDQDAFLQPALWWESAESNAVKCFLCPRGCRISSGNAGFCRVRKNIGGKLYSLSYGYPAAVQIDPIEKKPLAEFLPGSKTFSIGTFGCNLDCCFCQNSSLSRGDYAGHHQFMPPRQVVEFALETGCRSVAFTYNEPTVFAEYAIDVAKIAHEQGLSTVLVSNGYITLQAAHDLYPLMDAANIDMKGFSEDFYRKMTGTHLDKVLDAIEYYYRLGKHLEITNLVIPGKNDAPEMIDAFLDWMAEKLDKNIPLHFSAYHPSYQYTASPPTPAGLLHNIRDRAVARGFTAIYLGNI